MKLHCLAGAHPIPNGYGSHSRVNAEDYANEKIPWCWIRLKLIHQQANEEGVASQLAIRRAQAFEQILEDR